MPKKSIDFIAGNYRSKSYLSLVVNYNLQVIMQEGKCSTIKMEYDEKKTQHKVFS